MYQFIKDHSSEFPVEKMCLYLAVSRSGYYDWKDRGPSKREQEDAELLMLIKKSHSESGGIYGLDKIHHDVKEQIPCGRKRVYRLMRANNISSCRPRKYKATTSSKHNLPVAENLLNQNFSVDKPSKVWVTDISYIWTDEGWEYLATVKDLFNKEIVGWAMSNTMTKELTIKALKNAVQKRRPPAGLIHHSDRGVQYCSKAYQALLAEHKMLCSMSRKGNCYDNASAETFFSTIKNELIYLCKFRSRDMARRAVFEYIEIFYNRKRRHQSLNYLTPLHYLNNYLQRTA